MTAGTFPSQLVCNCPRPLVTASARTTFTQHFQPVIQAITTPVEGVKPTPARVRSGSFPVVALACAVGLAACGPMVERAPFSTRPDTLTAGDLLGPFDGVAVDAETERPIGRALVAASWAFERGLGLVGPTHAVEWSGETSEDGHYRIPELERLQPPGGSGPSTRVARFTLIVYKRGFVAWRSDRVFDRTNPPRGHAPRRDFAQRGNRVRMQKWSSEASHARHLHFLGGGEAVTKAAFWERQLASLELRGTASPTGTRTAATGAPASGGLLDAGPLLRIEEIRGVTGYAGEFRISRLGDLPRTEFYDSLHFHAEGQPERFDVAVRLWRLGAAGAEDQFRKLLEQLPTPEARDELGDRSARVKSAEARALAFIVSEQGLVVSVTCGVGQCTEAPMLVRLAKLIEGHLRELTAPAPAAAGDAVPVADPFETAKPEEK